MKGDLSLLVLLVLKSEHLNHHKVYVPEMMG